MFKAIKPLSNPAMGACWQGKNFQFGLVATDVVCIRYLFYADLLPQAGTEAALLNLVELDKQFQFGDVWGWQAEYSGKKEAPLTYLIQLEKSDGTKHFVIDPFARESRGGEQWGRTLGFAVDAEDYSLKVFSRTQDYFFHGIRRLPVLRPETPTVKITSRPPAPQHSLEQSIVYECHLRGMTRSPSSTVADSTYSGTYQGLTNCIPHLKTLGVTAVELLPVFDFDETKERFLPVTILIHYIIIGVIQRFSFLHQNKIMLQMWKMLSRNLKRWLINSTQPV